jgi:hypothetical protein
MIKNITTVGLMMLLAWLPMSAVSQEKPKKQSQDDAKELSGISIVGNKEAPKSLFIVPWKSSELGVETGLASRLLNEKMQAVDKEVFERELDFYTATTRQ